MRVHNDPCAQPDALDTLKPPNSFKGSSLALSASALHLCTPRESAIVHTSFLGGALHSHYVGRAGGKEWGGGG